MQGIIFDLDGVICSTDKYHYLAWKQLADEIGVYFNEEINNRLRGISRMESLDIILESTDRVYTAEDKELFAEKKNCIYRKLLNQMSTYDLSVEVAGTLLRLKLMGYPYHLFDAPMIKTYINAYSGDPVFCNAVMDKIMGRSAFKGTSPVDPFCGKDYLR